MTSGQAAQTEASQEKVVSFADAAQTALKDAGLEKDAVKFSKQMRTYEDGMPVYEIKFVVPGEAKYEYVIDDKTGEIKKKESEAWEAEDDADYAALLKENQNFFDYEAEDNAQYRDILESKGLNAQ